MDSRVWLVYQISHKDGEWLEEDIQISGVFDSEENAISACRDFSYCIDCFIINEQLPHEKVENKTGYFPYFNYDAQEWEQVAKKRTTHG